MGCFRLGCSFVLSLLGATMFIVVGAFLGAILPLVVSSPGTGNEPKWFEQAFVSGWHGCPMASALPREAMITRYRSGMPCAETMFSLTMGMLVGWIR